jgi:lipopolysaccharide transport system permease protein
MGHFALLAALTRREFENRYKGTLLGKLWPLLQPIVMMLVFTFVFELVMNVRWRTGDTADGGFALFVLLGLITFTVFSDTINRCVTIINSNAPLVKKVAFPLTMLPLSITLSNLLQYLINLVIWLVLSLLLGGRLELPVIALPIVWFALSLLTLGFALFVAALGVFFKDLSFVIGFLTTTLLFLSPIFFHVDVVPPQYQWVVASNPIADHIALMRLILIDGQWPTVESLVKVLLTAFVSLSVGYTIFLRLRKGFADVV